MNEFRRLQRLCEQQAALTSTLEARRVLKEMAVEYRRRAEYLEQNRPSLEPSDRPSVGFDRRPWLYP
jgi:hypothetical protein